MSATLLAPLAELTEIQRAVRDQFQKGGSLTALLLVMSGLAAVLLVAYYLTLRQRKAAVDTRHPDPQGLFNDLLNKLDLTPPQRRLLEGVARALRLGQPTVILLSPALFDRYLDQFRARQTGVSGRHQAASTPGESARSTTPGPGLESDLIAETHAVLFPQP